MNQDDQIQPDPPAHPPGPVPDAAWRTSCLRLCMHLGLGQTTDEKWTDTLHKISKASLDLSAFVIEQPDLDSRRRRYHVAELVMQRWPTIAPEELPRVVRALVRGCVEDVPAGGLRAGGVLGGRA